MFPLPNYVWNLATFKPHLSLKYGISKQQISEIRKNREKIMKSTNNLETSEELHWKSF